MSAPPHGVRPISGWLLVVGCLSSFNLSVVSERLLSTYPIARSVLPATNYERGQIKLAIQKRFLHW